MFASFVYDAAGRKQLSLVMSNVHTLVSIGDLGDMEAEKHAQKRWQICKCGAIVLPIHLRRQDTMLQAAALHI